MTGLGAWRKAIGMALPRGDGHRRARSANSTGSGCLSANDYAQYCARGIDQPLPGSEAAATWETVSY